VRGPVRPRQLARISGPVVFIHGTADTIVKPNVAVAAQRMVPGCRLRWVEGGGHFMLGADPDLVARRGRPRRPVTEPRAAQNGPAIDNP
jgi:pimeloyl-ACP methyl ester carboxylesterase